jgi:hypothetical protein
MVPRSRCFEILQLCLSRIYKPWQWFDLYFQPLENRAAKLPIIGKIAPKSSKHWKMWTQNFQALEELSRKVPTIGNHKTVRSVLRSVVPRPSILCFAFKTPTINLSGASVSRVRSRFWLESPFCGFEWYHVHGALKSYKPANHAAVPNTPALHLIRRAV